ncbi:alpha/beta-hydrolase [Xylariomycetidae sp. FL0641]|nr:alpha/beta-hydrolase [Xylariomycetidae sp. FL0641]
MQTTAPPIAARLVFEGKPYLAPGKLHVKELWFEVPLDYSKPDSKTVKLFARSAVDYNKPIVEPSETLPPAQKPYLVYLQGGPGFGCSTPQDSPLSSHMLERGYELLLLDQRGTGLSCPISANTLEMVGGPQEQADYLKHFRADTIVKDCEAVRLCLTGDYPPEKKKWSTFGQSFGGMITLTYLSFAPEGLRECFVTGGIVPVDMGPDEIYQVTYQRVMERNLVYYKKFPEDVDTVKWVAQKIRELGGDKGVPLPGGGFLTVPRLMSIGLNLGMDGGVDKVHNLILRMKSELIQFGVFTRYTLTALEQEGAWDIAPIYAILHEPIWCYKPGVASNWAAERVGKGLEQFQWLQKDWTGPDSLGEEPLYFSGEMVYPFYFETCSELMKMRETAQILAAFDQWPSLYDPEQLKKNDIPVYAAMYNDMYVDTEQARRTARNIQNIKVFETNVLFHSALRTKSETVFRELLRLRDDTID